MTNKEFNDYNDAYAELQKHSRAIIKAVSWYQETATGARVFKTHYRVVVRNRDKRT